MKFPPYDANEKLRSKWTDSFAEFVIAKIILEFPRNWTESFLLIEYVQKLTPRIQPHLLFII
jgi:ABC-type maltose transport system permease subunit